MAENVKTIDRNLPNKLTLSRIVLVPVFMVVLCLPLFTAVPEWVARLAAAVIFGACSLTDMFDGKLARKYNLISNFGKFMDPLADKFLIIGSLLAAVLAYNDNAAMRVGLIVSLTVIIFRELAVSSMRLIAKNADGAVIAAAMPGKIKTTTQIIFVLLLLCEDMFFGWISPIFHYLPLTWICMALMLFFTVYSGILYFISYKKYIFS